MGSTGGGFLQARNDQFTTGFPHVPSPFLPPQVESQAGVILDERKDYEELEDCATKLELTDEWPALMRIIAGILHLGNIEFIEEGDGGTGFLAGTFACIPAAHRGPAAASVHAVVSLCPIRPVWVCGQGLPCVAPLYVVFSC